MALLGRSSVRFAVVGAGFAGAAHVEALRRVPGVEVKVVVASSEETAAAAARRLGVAGACGDYRVVLDDANIDVIDNCTPNYLHAEITEAALAAGKHVLVEKPLAMDSSQTGRLVELAARSQVVTGVCFNYRHFPLASQARAMLAVRQPHMIRGGYLQDWLLYPDDWNWRLLTQFSGESRAVGDIGSHWIDLVQHITGRRMIRVCARLGRLHDVRRRPAGAVVTFQRGGEEGEDLAVMTDDFAMVMFELDGGCPGVFTVSQVSPGMRNRLTFEIDTADASIAWNQEDPNRLWIGHRDRPNEELLRDPALLDPSAAALTHYPAGHQEGWPDALANLMAEFTEQVIEHARGEPRSGSMASFHDADRVMRTVEAILQADRSGGWVDVVDRPNAAGVAARVSQQG
jgi:predicted dehydrogenase